jgi:3-hydroxybutyryl-CoA dehydratase
MKARINDRIAKWGIEDLSEGDECAFESVISETSVNEFAEITGDFSTIHMEDDFAQERGYKRRVVHGALMIGYLSRMIGMHLPGENAFLHSLSVRFIHPSYIGDKIRVHAVVEQISTGTGSAVLLASVTNRKTKEVLVRCRIQIGFTTPRNGNLK